MATQSRATLPVPPGEDGSEAARKRPERTPEQAAAFRRIVRHLLAPLDERADSGTWQ